MSSVNININVSGPTDRDLDELIEHMTRLDQLTRLGAVANNATALSSNAVMTGLLRAQADQLTDLANKGDIIQALRSPSRDIVNVLNARAQQLAWEKRELALLEELDPLDYENNPLEGIF